MTDSSFEIFPWNDNLETGIHVIDQQHRKLVDILNLLADHLANRARANVLDQVFDELADYASYHFKTEEAIWHEHMGNDEWFINHKKIHASFFEQVAELKANQGKLPVDEIVQQALAFLTQWLATHILDSDKRLAKVVLSIEAGNSLEEAKKKANEEISGATKLLIKTILSMYESLSARSLELLREKALRKQTEQKLLESEERWQFLLEGKEENVWDWNIDRDDFQCSAAEPPLFDIAFSNLLVGNNQYRVHPADIEKVRADLKAHLEGKTDFYINKHRIFRETGSWGWILSKGKIVSRDEEGNALRMIGVHIDISEKELATQIYQSSSQAMFVCDIYNQIIAINPAFKNITGLDETDVIGKHPRILCAGACDDTSEELRNSMQQTSSWRGEIWGKRKNDGEDYCIAMNINMVTDDSGEIEQYIGLFSDITDKKQAEMSLLQKEQEKHEIFNATLHSTHHIVNNLLNQMIFFKMKAKESNAFDAETTELFEEVMKEGGELLKKLGAVKELTEDSIMASIAPVADSSE